MILSSCENHTQQQQQKLERLVPYMYLDQQKKNIDSAVLKWSWWGQQYKEIRNNDQAIEKESK